MNTMMTIGWDDFVKLSSSQKASVLKADAGQGMFHILLAQQFGRKELDDLGDLATKIRFIAKTDKGAAFLGSLLPQKRVMLYFSQPSTRTFLSFLAASQILGMRIGEVRDASVSSEFKGESREDSVRTFSSYYDCIVMRTEIGGLAERMAWVLSNTDRPVPIINAGSGKDQHPTQALLDIYTLQRSFEKAGGIDGKTVVFVGDLARGRTVRSLSYLLTNYKKVKQVFIAPKQLQIGSDVVEMLKSKKVNFELGSKFSDVIREVDAVYMTRIQDEWDQKKGESACIDISSFNFKTEYLHKMKKSAVIMHPFPRRAEIPTEVDGDERAVYWRQMRNGMWIRTALIASIFGKNKAILDYELKSRK